MQPRLHSVDQVMPWLWARNCRRIPHRRSNRSIFEDISFWVSVYETAPQPRFLARSAARFLEEPPAFSFICGIDCPGSSTGYSARDRDWRSRHP